MPLSLHAAVIPSNLQIIGSVQGLLDKAEAFCAEGRGDPAELLDARLAADMLPLAYQVKSVAVHSWGAIEGVRRGLFSPEMSPPPASFPLLRERLAEAADGLASVGVDEMESFVGRDMRFEIGDRLRLEFTADQFLLSFAQPNFYFHASAVYAILRTKGAAIGKRDFLGAMRLKP